MTHACSDRWRGFGDGEMRLLALPLGLTIGILAADHGRFGYDSTWPSLISKPSATGLVTLLAFLVVLIRAGTRFRFHEEAFCEQSRVGRSALR